MTESEKQETPSVTTPVIGLLGSKGGVGSSTIAINLAASFASGVTTLIDANLQQPDVALLLAREPKFSLLELVARRGHLDKQVFEACSIEAPGLSSVRLVSPPADGHAGAKMSLSDLHDCLPEVSKHCNRIVIDLPRHLDRHLVTMLDAMTVIALVIEPNFSSIASAKRLLSTFDDLGYNKNKIALVVNRFGGKLKYIDEQLTTSFQGQEWVKVPNVYALSESCSIEGEPIVLKHPRDAYSKAMKSLAAFLDERSRQILTANERASGLSMTMMPQL